MKKLFAFLRWQVANNDTFVEWPFFAILTIVFGFVYFESLILNPDLREPGSLILFTLLMSVHTALHWLSVRLKTWRQVFFYLVIQSALAFTITYLSANLGPLLGLYMGLIGETIGLLREKPRWTIAAVAVLLTSSFVNYGLQGSWVGWYWWILAMLPMTFFVVIYVTLYSRQAEARARAQILLKDLEAANRQVSEYAAQVEDLTLVNERQRMARELHDTLSQGLAGLILQLEAVDAHLASQRVERGRAILQQSMEKARGTLAEARQAIDNLRRPPGLDLVEAALQESRRFTNATGIAIESQFEVKVDVPGMIAETAIRTMSESLTNTARHARAKAVQLRMIAVERQLKIDISDDGVGFNPEAVQSGHYGLLGMCERVRLAGGSLDILSGPGKGTQIVIRFPLSAAEIPPGSI
jgi:NarL family two-component system sensor histidine kinase YdfH